MPYNFQSAFCVSGVLLFSFELRLLFVLICRCRARSAIVLRPRDFYQHDTAFIIQISAQPNSNRHSYDCRRVPPHLSKSHWTTLMSSPDLCDQLVLHKSQVIDRLAKFENQEFIHTYTDLGSAALIFEFPRYGLEFKFVTGKLLSSDYSGYRLAQCQQLVSDIDVGNRCEPFLYSLPNFQQYIVLERLPTTSAVVGAQRADKLVLVPAGKVTKGSEAMVMIGIPLSCQAQLKVVINI